MGQHLTLGGERLGSGKKMKVDTKTFNRSTFNQSRIFRSTMAMGTLVPFLVEYGLAGTTFDIDLDCYINTHPTLGPLFGSAKVQLDIFQAPLRLYNALLHNNKLNIGRDMTQVKLPQIKLNAINIADLETKDLDNLQINPSCILSYLGIRGIGINPDGIPGDLAPRTFNAIPLIAYWDIYKNYYANKQEEIGAVLHTPSVAVVETVDEININTTEVVAESPATSSVPTIIGDEMRIEFTGTQPIPSQIILQTDQGLKSAEELAGPFSLLSAGVLIGFMLMDITLVRWRYQDNADSTTGKPTVATFPLQNIDGIREDILAYQSMSVGFEIPTDLSNGPPYSWLTEQPNGIPNTLSSQEGLGLKTYNSDLFNNWLKTENIDAITTQTGIDVSGGVLTIDQFIVSKKVWDMLNAINVSGGTYDDWQQVVYDHDPYRRCETPMYMGGLIKELIFQQVVSNSENEGSPLGSLAGRGTLADKHKGGHIVIRLDEASIIIGIVSITPRIDYSQGNEWHVHLKTMDDFHKPFLDGIGFQDLITEQMAWWDTSWDGAAWTQNSAGKQPAWLNYMTAVNKTYGNFAVNANEMFMTFNRRYEPADGEGPIDDVTTYIDPSKFNYIFAEQQLDAQNFWTQISVDMTSRRKMSSKIMPHL